MAVVFLILGFHGPFPPIVAINIGAFYYYWFVCFIYEATQPRAARYALYFLCVQVGSRLVIGEASIKTLSFATAWTGVVDPRPSCE